MHYAVAFMIAVLIRNKNEPKGILGSLNSTEISLPLFSKGPKALETTRLPVAPQARKTHSSHADDKDFL
jgi:hypothetical protein